MAAPHGRPRRIARQATGHGGIRRSKILAAVGGLAVGAVLLSWLVYQVSLKDEEAMFGHVSRQESSDRGGAPEAVSAATVDPLWHEVDETAVVPLPDYAEEWSELGRALVRLSGAAAAAGGWRPGDRLGLPVPQLETVCEAVIEEVDDGPGLSRAAVAAVRDGSQDRRVVVTVGPAHTFAYIDTPKGSYELLAGREFGWLLPSSSMQARFDFSKSDPP